MVFEDEFADLLHLVGFGLSAFGLNIDDFFDAVLVKNRMTAFPRASGETGAFQDEAEVGKVEVRVGTTFEDFGDSFFDAAQSRTS